MKKALVIGATGLVGRQLIKLLLADKRYTVLALVRKPLAIIHSKLSQVTFDFNNPDGSLIVADEIFCCLGTTIKTAGSKPAFYKVDFEYVLKVAELGFANGVKKFAMISSVGANKSSAIFYNQTKGAIEEAVTGIGFESLYILRPSILLGERNEFRLGETIGKFLVKAFRFLVPAKYKGIEASQVTKAMIVCMNEGAPGVHILESNEIAAL